jgi:RHS repeat-associated protein
MRNFINALVAFVFLFNAVFSTPHPSSGVASTQTPVAPTATRTPVSTSEMGAYPAPATATPTPPAPTATATPTTVTPISPTTPTLVTPSPTSTTGTAGDDLALQITSNLKYLPDTADTPLQIQWQIGGSGANKIKEWTGYELRLIDTGTSKEIQTISINSLSGVSVLNIPGIASTNKTILAGQLLLNGKPVATSRTTLSRPEKFEISAKGGKIASKSQKISVNVGSNALSEDATFFILEDTLADETPAALSRHPFVINAESLDGKREINKFNRSIEISVQYDPSEIDGEEKDLIVEYFDVTKNSWVTVDSVKDTKNHVLTFSTNHLTQWDYTVESINQYKLNDLSAFKNSEFTGTATYSVPINVPAGPGGLTPSVSLNYYSGIPDAAGNDTQASWVGMGWDLNVGSIDRVFGGGKMGQVDDAFSISLNGINDELIPTTKVILSSGDYPYYVEYNTKNVSFLRIRRYVKTMDEGCVAATNTCAHKDLSYWQVWDKSGNVYTFGSSSPWDTTGKMYYPDFYGTGEWEYDSLISSWKLISMKNSDEKTIFTYYYDPVSLPRDNGANLAKYQTVAMYLQEIRYYGNIYRVYFEREARYDFPDCGELYHRCNGDMDRLHRIRVEYNPDLDAGFQGTQMIRYYQLNYQYGVVLPMVRLHSSVYGHSSLMNIQEYSAADHPLPATTFLYEDSIHLTSVNNGYNGMVKLIYENQPDNPNHDPWPTTHANMDVQYPDHPTYLRDRPSTYDWSNLTINNKNFPSGKGLLVGMDTAWEYTGRVKFILDAPGGMPDIDSGWIDHVSGNHSPNYVFKIPVTVPNRYDIWTIKWICEGICAIDSVFFQPISTHYRVTERRVYPKADVPDPNDPDTYFLTKYSYTSPALNNASNSTYSSLYKEYVFHPLSTEFRGHGQVKVTNPEGTSTVTVYNQSDDLKGNPISVTSYRPDATTIISQTLYNYDNAVVAIQPDSSALSERTQCKNVQPCDDMVSAHFIKSPVTETHTYNNAGTDYYATKAEVTYQTDTPFYGLVRSTKTSYKYGAAGTWTTQKTSYITYTNYVDTSKYIIGLPEYSVTCAGELVTSNALDACGSTPSNYLGITYNLYESTTGHLLEAYSLTNFDPGTTTVANNWNNRNFSAAKLDYDAYGNVTKSYQGYKTASTAAVYPTDRVTEACYFNSDYPACSDDGLGLYLAWEKKPFGQYSSYQYDRSYGGLPTQMNDPNGAVTSVTYDEFGRIAAVRKPGDNAAATPTYQFSYNDSSLSAGHFWTEAVQRIDDSHSLTVRKYYDGLGALIQTQQVGAVLADNACSTDADANPDTCRVVIDQETKYATVTGFPNQVKRTWQTAPYAVAVADGYIAPTWPNKTETVYDEQGRTVRVNHPDTTYEQTKYNVVSKSILGTTYTLLETSLIDANHTGQLNPPATMTYSDVFGRAKAVYPLTGPYLVYSYDAGDRLTEVKQVQDDNTVFATTTLNYDVAGRKTGMSDPDMGAWSYVYDAYGNLVSQTDAKGQTLSFGYDALNRMVTKQAIETVNNTTVVTPLASYSYDQGTNGTGHRTGMSQPTGEQSAWQYDPRGRVIQQTDVIPGVGAYTTAWTYDSADRVTGMTYPSGEVVTFANLPQGSVSSISTSLSTQGYLTSAAYDAAGRSIERLLGNGVRNTWNYYDWISTNQGGRLHTANAVMPASNTTWQNLTYGYDKVGNITSLSDTVANENLTFTYDALNRLDLVTGAYSDNPEYDGRGNLYQKKDLSGTTVTLTYPTGTNPVRPHAVQTAGGNNYQYDANGNMTQRIIGQVTYTLVYDKENHLTSISGGGLSAVYTYNADGTRVKAVITSGSVTKTTGYVGNYFEISVGQPRPSTPGTPVNCTLPIRCFYLPFVSNGQPYLFPGQAWYSYYYAGTSRIGMRIKSNQLNLNDTLVYYLSDHLGGTTITLNDSGTKTAELRYSAWGETRYTYGTTPTQLKFTGQIEDQAGLYFFQARFYDAYLNRFLSPDPYVPESQGVLAFDRYAYSSNNPIRYSDPSGHSIWDVIGQFATGFVVEFGRTTAWYSPHAQTVLSVNMAESDAMLVGRLAADVANIVVGFGEVAGGIALGAAGTAISCAATLCTTAVVTVGAGAVAVGAGATTALAGAAGFGGNLAQITGRTGSGNSIDPFTANNIPTVPHFWDRLNQYGWSGQQAYKVYQNGEKFTNQYGQNVRWDPKTGITLIIGPDDGRVITTEYNAKPMNNWESGWFDPD